MVSNVYKGRNTDVNVDVYIHLILGSVYWDNLEGIVQEQWAHLAPTSWFLNTILHWKEMELLGEMAGSKNRERESIVEPGTSLVRKYLNTAGIMSKGHRC